MLAQGECEMTKNDVIGAWGPGLLSRRFGAAMRLVSLSMLFLTGGCATTTTFRSPESPGNGQALVYFIRDHFPPFKRSSTVCKWRAGRDNG